MLIINASEIGRLVHECDGCKNGERFCCACYDVCVSFDEMQRIVGIFDKLVEYCPWIKVDGAYQNVFDETDDDQFTIDTVESGRCVFAYDAEGGEIFCAVHTVALSQGWALKDVKPLVCILWPLSLSETDPPELSVDSDAYEFHCNKRLPS